jgi:CPA1 family monovalent cation:H+ antiporter
MELIEISLALILGVALVGALARRLPIPLPILLILAGVALSFEPHLAALQLDPGIFFMLFIPPLLFADGWLFPKREFFTLRYPILFLAFGLVFATTVVVGYAVHWLVPTVPLAAAFALGAVISPTDAVALSEITHKLKLPTRMTAVLTGESLINDASGLVAFKFAVAAVVTGTFSLGQATISFALLAGGGALVGLAVAFLIQWVRLQIQRRGMEEPSVQIALSLLTPFAAYLAADRLEVSGILAVVIAGIYAGIDDNRHLTLETRLKAWDVWEMLLFVLNGLVFLMLGLQLRRVVEGMADHSAAQVAWYALAVSITVVLVRFAWMIPGSRISLWLTRLHYPNAPAARWRDILVGAWAGIRGAVTLAAALSLPLVAGGTPFPERDLLIFLATSVIVFTLVVNGLTLPLLIRWFRVTDDGSAEREARAARIAMSHAAIRDLRTRMDHQQHTEDHEFTLNLIREYERQVQHVTEGGDESTRTATVRVAAERSIRLHGVAAERSELSALHRSAKINEYVLFTLQRELDLQEASLRIRASGAEE